MRAAVKADVSLCSYLPFVLLFLSVPRGSSKQGDANNDVLASSMQIVVYLETTGVWQDGHEPYGKYVDSFRACSLKHLLLDANLSTTFCAAHFDSFNTEVEQIRLKDSRYI